MSVPLGTFIGSESNVRSAFSAQLVQISLNMLKVSGEMPQTFEHRRTEHFPISQHGDQWRLHADAGVAQATQVVTRPPNLAGPPNLAVLLTHCGQLIIREVSKFDATSCQILRPKCTKFDFRWGSVPARPRWGSLQCFLTP